MRIFVALTLLSMFLWADEDAPKGVPARPSASDYSAEARWQNAAFGASLIPSKQVEHLFAFDISKSYVVFEVACYADSAAALKLSRSGFVVQNALGETVHNAEPETVASAVQRQNLPSMPSSHGTNVTTSATVGYEHGNDPYTGRPVTGVYTAATVAVAGGNPDNVPVPRNSKPGGTSEDRRLLAAQLSARSIAEGPVNHPVAGYIFFRKSDLKVQPDDTYALQYLAETDGTGETHVIRLAVPKKTR